MNKIDIASQIFMAIKQNWSMNKDFHHLANLICQKLEVEYSQDVYDKLKNSGGLWLNNHLDEPIEDTDDDRLECDRAKLGTSETIGKKVVQPAKNHDYH
jgi:hypothetical protein